MKQLGCRVAALLAAVNAPLVVYAWSALSSPSSVTAFRTWAVATAGLSLVLHIGASFLVARWLRAHGSDRRAALPRDIIRGFGSQLVVAAGSAAALWWLSQRLSEALGRRTPSAAELAPLSTYGWIAVTIVLLLGSLTAVVVAFKQATLPRASLRP